MNYGNKPPRKRKQNIEGPQAETDTRPDSRDQPAAAERTDDPKDTAEKMDRQAPDATAADRQPVTNADEQERITNNESGNRPIPEN